MGRGVQGRDWERGPWGNRSNARRARGSQGWPGEAWRSQERPGSQEKPRSKRGGRQRRAAGPNGRADGGGPAGGRVGNMG